jgi:hypothetical protein
MTDTVEKVSGVAPIVGARKGFLELLPERNGASPSASTGTRFYPLTTSSVIKSDVFDDPKQPKYASGVLPTELSSYFVPYMRSPASPKPGTM